MNTISIQDIIQFIPTGFEWILIVVIVVILIFGTKKILELARGLGKASTEYKKAQLEAKKELQNIRNNSRTTDLDREKLESIAETLGIDYTKKSDAELKNAIEAELDQARKRTE